MAEPALCFEPEPVLELPGPAVGPKGPKIGQEPGAGFIILYSLRSAKQGQGNPGGREACRAASGLAGRVGHASRSGGSGDMHGKMCFKLLDSLVSLRICNENYHVHFDFGRFWTISRPSFAPRPVPTGWARKVVQSAPNIPPGDQF